MTDARWNLLKERCSSKCHGCRDEAAEDLRNEAWGRVREHARVAYEHDADCNVPLARAAELAAQGRQP